MTDHLTKEKRSWNMSRIRSKNTKPEMIVRSFLFSKGFRYRLHNRKLPGKPDISNASKKIAGKNAVKISDSVTDRHLLHWAVLSRTSFDQTTYS